MANGLLILHVGASLFGDLKMAKTAAYLYILSHSVVYQVSFYSENTFVFFTLIGLYFIQSSQQKLPFAALAFSFASMTRSTGVLLSVFVAFKMLRNIIYAKTCC
jgi:Gpi18-like mannosyltransferase